MSTAAGGLAVEQGPHDDRPWRRQLRDLAIASAYRGGDGLSLRQLGRVHDLSPARVWSICRAVGDDWRIRRGFQGSAGERPRKTLSRMDCLIAANQHRKK